MVMRLLGSWFVRLAVGSVLAWVMLSYGLLPKLWQHSNRAKAETRLVVTRTKQGLPGDPINVSVQGDRNDLLCLFGRIGWRIPQRVSLKSAVKISASIVVNHPYATAPVSALYYDGRMQDLAFEQEVGRSANRRHHVRFWQVGPAEWLGAATFDIGSGLNKYTGQITHHINSAVDQERDALVRLLAAQGATTSADRLSGLPPQTVLQNGGGDKFTTDGKIKSLTVPRICRKSTAQTQ